VTTNRFISCIVPFALYASAACAKDPEILTPKPSQKPQIHGAKVYGVHPGHPLLYRIPATGTRPMTFSAKGLPKGLKLDSATGIISGIVKEHGEYQTQLHAKNSLGSTERPFRIAVGDKLALTPPMGWSSWYMAYTAISDKLVRDQADGMVASGMADHGYSMVNIDDGWNIKLDSKDPEIGGAPRDADGNLRPNKRFPDMKALTDYIHSKGLTAGIYIGPGPRTCGGYEASYGHEEQDAKQFAKWGFDFLKYDLCSYRKLIKDPNSREEQQKPYLIMNAAVQKLDRDMMFNFCQYGLGNVWEWGRETGGHFWRTTGDVGGGGRGSLWQKMEAIGFGQAGKEKYAGPGGWNDPDNILIGHILWDKKLVPTPLTQDEQYTWVTLWSIMASPLVFGGDMTKLDDFTLSLLTNDEAIDINQDTLGKQGYPVSKDGTSEIWYKPLEDGSIAIALFNRGESEAKINAKWSELRLDGKWVVRDVWRQHDLGAFSDEYSTTVPKHGSVFLKLRRKA
jgi:alpha-galactosidase